MTNGLTNDRVVARNPEGELVFIPREQASLALRSGFSAPSFAEQEAFKAAVEEEKSYEGFVPSLEAGAAAVLRGATLKGSDVVLEKGAKLFGGEEAEQRMKRRLEGLEEKHPYISGAGEIAGFVGPLLLSGGTAAGVRGAAEVGLAAAAKTGAKTAIRGLGAIPRAVTGLGEMAAAKTAGVVGKGLGGRMATAAVQNAVEGALIEGGAALSETALSEHPELTAELILSRIAKGALTGAVFGAAMPVAGAAASSIGRKGKEALGSIAGTLEKTANEAAFQALDPSLKHYRQVDRFAGGPEELGNLIRKEAKVVSNKPFELFTVDDFEKLGQISLKRYGYRLEKSLTKLDSLPVKSRPNFDELIDKMTLASDEMATKVMGQAKSAGAISVIEDFIDKAKVVKDGSIDFSELNRLRRELDDFAYVKGTLNPTPAQEAARDLRSVVEDYFMEKADDAVGTDLGKAFVEDYLASKKGYQMARYVSDITQDAELRSMKNRKISITDMIAAGAGLASMGIVGLGAGIVNKVRREQGDQIMAGLTGRAASLLAVKKAADSAKEEMASGVKSFLSETGKSKGLVKVPLTLAFSGKTEKERTKSYNDYVEALDNRIANPQEQFAQVANKMGNLSQVAPQTAAALVQAKLRQDEILRSKQPKGRRNADEIFPTKAPPQVSDDEMSKFSRYVAVAENGPQVLVDELKHKMVNPETVEAVKTMYPASFEELKAQIMQEATAREKDLSYSQKLQLSRLFGIPSDFSTKPKTIQAFQQTFKPAQPTGAAGPSKAKKPPSVAGQFMTTSQRVEQGER